MAVTRRSSWSRGIAGAFTLLIALAAILTSYAVAAGWMPPHLANGSIGRAVSTWTMSEARRDSPAQPPRSEPRVANQAATAGAPSGVRLGAQDGYVPDGVVLSPWDTDHPAVASLDPGLLDAIQRAAADADADGIVMVINSGWRSERYQQALLDEAVVTYGSEGEARKWVSSPDASTHVTGDAVDIGYEEADHWLIEHGNAYGLCQTYANEIWHFELAVEPGEACPPPRPDASERASEDAAAMEGVISNRIRVTRHHGDA